MFIDIQQQFWTWLVTTQPICIQVDVIHYFPIAHFTDFFFEVHRKQSKVIGDGGGGGKSPLRRKLLVGCGVDGNGGDGDDDGVCCVCICLRTFYFLSKNAFVSNITRQVYQAKSF